MQRRNKSATPARPSSPGPSRGGGTALEMPVVKSPSSSSGGGGGGNGITIPSGGGGSMAMAGVHSHSHSHVPGSASKPKQIPLATVVRHTFGTGPFDKIWLNTDCCGLFCAAFTYFLHLYGCYAVTTIILPPWMSYPDNSIVDAVAEAATAAATDGSGSKSKTEAAAKIAVAAGRHLSFWGKFHTVAFTLIAFLAVAAHFKAMTTDPGAVPPDAEPVCIPCPADERANLDDKHNITEPLVPKQLPKRSKRICRRCNSFKPDRAHHCSICKRCIVKMDHHCPWVNNCVGIGNHKYFLLFVFYTCLSCMYAMTLVIMRFVQCIGKIEHHEPCLDNPEHLLGIIGLCVESLLFGMFTCCMIIDQWDVVSTNVTHIDRLKGDTKMEDLENGSGISEVFGSGSHAMNMSLEKKGKKGSGFRPDWLSPFAKVCFPENLRDDIMGFCRPCGFGSTGKKDKVEDDDGGMNMNLSGSSPSSVEGRRNVSGRVSVAGDIV